MSFQEYKAMDAQYEIMQIFLWWKERTVRIGEGNKRKNKRDTVG